MGCASSTRGGVVWKEKRRVSGGTVASLENDDVIARKIERQFGHPALDKEHGYDFGLRVRVRSNKVTIFVAASKVDGSKVTVKECHLKHYTEKYIVDEIYLLTELAHECLPQLHAVFITDASLFVITEYMDPGRLKNFVNISQGHTSFSILETKQIVSSLASVVSYCHEQRYIVRNLTADNVVLRKEQDRYRVLLADMSYAVPFGTTEMLSDHPLFDWSDVYYAAPEALLGSSYTAAMDFWSLGILMYLMLTGTLPFQHEDDRTLVHMIKIAAYGYSGVSHIPTPARQIISRLIVPVPSDRMTAKELLKEPWMQDTTM